MTGHQLQVMSGGESFLTLADLWPDPCRVVIVGVNPAPGSVKAGHYYQGNDGRRAIGRLRAAGLLPPDGGGYADDEAIAAGVGFTDLVKRPTGRATELNRAELDRGRTELLAKLEHRQVSLVVCIFKPAVLALLGNSDPPGFQSRRFCDAPVFRMPGPYDRKEHAEAAMATLAKATWPISG